MPEQQDTFDRPFCQTAISRGRSRAFFVQILSVDRPLYLSLQGHCRKSDITDESLMPSVDGFIG